MLTLLLLSCSAGVDATGAIPAEVEQEGAPASYTVFSAEIVVGDPLLTEVDAAGNVTWQIHVKDALGSYWHAERGYPILMDVQPVKGGTFLLSLYGLGLVEINRAGEVVWHHDDPAASHDVDRLANGNTIYARTWAAQGENAVVEVNPAGAEVWTWSGVEAFGSDPRFDGYSDEGQAWMHPTAVQRLADGRTSICMRNFNEIALVDGAGKVVREVTFQSPEADPGPKNTGNLRGHRPHGAEWRPGHGLSVALRSPDRAVAIEDGAMVRELRSPEISGITDVDVLDDGHVLLAAHDRVQEVDADGAVVWSWVVPSEPTGSDDRARHIFQTIARLDADGGSVDFD